ncbi:hypothetical protein JW879_08225 [candidate division WOR-3 bacterium]|nr:hypothetical protein [candidate division WOR-3 bacterium]
MKRFLLLMMPAIMVFAQETYIQVKADRKIESNLVKHFDSLPERIDVFMTSDSTYIIEAIYRNKKLVKKMASAEYHSLTLETPSKMVTLEDAKISFLVGQTFHGLSIYSWSLPVMFSEGDWSEGQAAIALLTPLIYTSTCFLLTKDRRISSGAAYGSFLGGIEGAFHGGYILKSEKGIFPGSLAENILDFTLGQNMNFTPAMYQRKFNHCLYGYYHYYSTRTLFGGRNLWGDPYDLIQLGTILSLAEGYTSLFMSKDAENLTFGDALFELRTSTIGAEALPLILWTIDLHRNENSDERVYAALTLVGHGAGYLWGHKLSRDNDLPGAAGVMTWLLPYLAHAATGGIAVLVDKEGFLDTYPTIFLTMDVLLTSICYKAFAKKSLDIGKADIPNFNMSVNPMCFVLKDKNKTFENMPFITFSYNF